MKWNQGTVTFWSEMKIRMMSAVFVLSLAVDVHGSINGPF